MSDSGLPSLSALAGRWSLLRDITHDDGARHHFDGEAMFSWSGPRLIEMQTGTLDIGTQVPLKASRRYVWTNEGRRIEVLFDDMRPFHTIPTGTARPETTHLCPPDRYHVAYDFTRFPDWGAVWEVEGPRKAYRMESRYRRTDERAR